MYKSFFSNMNYHQLFSVVGSSPQTASQLLFKPNHCPPQPHPQFNPSAQSFLAHLAQLYKSSATTSTNNSSNNHHTPFRPQNGSMMVGHGHGHPNSHIISPQQHSVDYTGIPGMVGVIGPGVVPGFGSGVGGVSSAGGLMKRKKPRTSFTRLQICELEKRFHQQKYLASGERATLASKLNMTDSQVKTWFQNRRTKWR